MTLAVNSASSIQWLRSLQPSNDQGQHTKSGSSSEHVTKAVDNDDDCRLELVEDVETLR